MGRAENVSVLGLFDKHIKQLSRYLISTWITENKSFQQWSIEAKCALPDWGLGRKCFFEFLFMLMSTRWTRGEAEAVYRDCLQTDTLYCQTLLAAHVSKLLPHIVNRKQHNGLQSQGKLFQLSNDFKRPVHLRVRFLPVGWLLFFLGWCKVSTRFVLF